MFVTGRPLESVCVSPNAAEGENEAGVLVGPPTASPGMGWDWDGDGSGLGTAKRCADFATRSSNSGRRSD